MRDTERLDKFYNELKELHKTCVPDWRAGQLFSNFIQWLWNNKKMDVFFPEEDSLLELFKEYLKKD